MQQSTHYGHSAQGPCEFFAADDSCRGCNDEHHDNLDPYWVGKVEPKGHMVPNVVGEACQFCVDNLRECDKGRRDPDSRDPCSECREFGGPDRKCVPSKISYNDGVYRLMLTRGRADPPYSLPPFRARNDKGPMSAENVKNGWRGESRETLLAKGDLLRAEVRAHPRAFLVPQKQSARRDSRRAYVREHPESQHSFHERPPSFPSGQHTPMPPPPRRPVYQQYAQPQHKPTPLQPPNWVTPPVDPLAGRVTRTYWEYNDRNWVHEYENGARVLVPTSQPARPMAQPHHKSQASRQYGNHTNYQPAKGYNAAPIPQAPAPTYPASSPSQTRPAPVATANTGMSSASRGPGIPQDLLDTSSTEEPGRKRMRSDSTASAPVFRSHDLTANPDAVDVNDYGSDDDDNVIMANDDVRDYR